jgi:hypothetical protein
MQIGQRQIDQFVHDGFTLIDDVCTEQEMIAAGADFDHLYTHGEKTSGISQYFYEPGLVDVLRHPNLERAAKVMLRAERQTQGPIRWASPAWDGWTGGLNATTQRQGRSA